MRVLRTALLTAATVLVAAPLSAQTVDTAQARFQQPQAVQYIRFQDKRGINVFETPKVAGVEYTGFRMAWGAAFTQQFQGLDHENSADSVAVAAVAATPGNAGTAAISDKNRLMEIGNGFNNAAANMYLHAQLAPGIRLQLTSYLSSRHHNETWVKDGFLQIDESPLDVPLFHSIMKYTTLKIGHFEINYGDFHFRRSDNGQAMYNPFAGNAIMEAFTTEVGTEAIVQKNGIFAVLALTNGEIRGNTTRPDDRAPAYMAKLGFDRQLSEDLRVRLSGSYRSQESAISNTFYTGDRAGSRYNFVMENWKATESGQASSGLMNPGFSDKVTAMMINPFVKFHGLEFFGMYEAANGRAAPNTNAERDVNQYMGELLYRFAAGEKAYVGARWTQVEGDFGTGANAVNVTRGNIGGGWFITPSLLLKAEVVDQHYRGFATTDIRYRGKFSGFMIEAVTAF